MDITEPQEQVDSAHSIRWKIIGVILLVILVILLRDQFSFRDPSPEGYRKAVEVLEGRKRVDRLCDSIPLPNNSRLEYRAVEGNTRTYAVSYHFTSALQISSLKEFYSDWLTAENWQKDPERNLTFEKVPQRIAVEFGGGGSYSINCSESF